MEVTSPLSFFLSFFLSFTLIFSDGLATTAAALTENGLAWVKACRKKETNSSARRRVLRKDVVRRKGLRGGSLTFTSPARLLFSRSNSSLSCHVDDANRIRRGHLHRKNTVNQG